MTKNPYTQFVRTVKKIGNVILAILAIIFVVVVLLIAPVVAGFQHGWGWWSLLLVFIFPVLILLVGLVGTGLDALGEKIARAWRAAEHKWDVKNRSGE